jgi:Copper binding proteins, plastocyanin/azurin family
MRRAVIAIALVGVAAAAVALPVFAQAPKLTGSVGPGFTISMKKPTRAGKATLVVSDRSRIHNFHLRGPGVNVKTSVSGRGTRTFAVTFAKGRYTFLCNPHPTSMRGSFTIR